MIKLVPAAIPVTNPELLTVAISGDAETHGLDVAAVGDPVNCVADPIQTLKLPVMVGKEFTTTNTL